MIRFYNLDLILDLYNKNEYVAYAINFGKHSLF